MGLTNKQLSPMYSKWADSSTNAYEKAKGRQQESAESQLARDAKIAELVKSDELGQRAVEANLRRANEQAEHQGLKPGEYSVTASEKGIGVNPEDKLNNWLRGQQVQNAMDEKQNRAVERFADRSNKLGIPARSADLMGLEATTASPGGKGGMLTNPNYKAKSASKVLGWTPDFAKPAVASIGEAMGGFEKGTGAEQQALQALYNSQIKSESGAAVNMHEQGRQDIALGTKTGDSEAIKRGVQRIKRALEMDTQLLEGSGTPGVKGQFRKQGGEYDINKMVSAKPSGSAGAPSFEEWKRMKAGK